MREETLRVEEDRVRADGHDDGDARSTSWLPSQARLVDDVPHHRLLGRLADALGKRFHVVAGHAAVVGEALVHDDEFPSALREVVVVEARKPPIGTKWSFFDEKTAPSLSPPPLRR